MPLLLIGCAFVFTRAPLAWLADHPDAYGPPDTKVTGDAQLYAHWADELAAQERDAYSQIRIEYPPGSLPFLVGPRLWQERGGDYRSGLIALMLLIDVAGLVGTLLLARGGGRLLGAWLWVVALPALGPLSLLRLDLVPAVATLWGLVLLARRGFVGAGAALGFAVLAKLYAALLAPLVWLRSSGRRGLLAGASVVLVLGLLPFARDLPSVWQSVIGYHAARGIQVESNWGLALLVAGALGYPASVSYDFGAFHISAPISATLETVAAAAALVVWVLSTWLGGVSVPRGDPRRLAAAIFALLAGVMVAGTVLSPQFLLWLLAPAAAACALPAARPMRSVLLVVPAAALSQVVYPFLYNDLLAGDAAAVVVLALRNIMLAAAAVGTWVELRSVSSSRLASPLPGGTRRSAVARPPSGVP